MDLAAGIVVAVLALNTGVLALAVIVAPVAVLARLIRARADFTFERPHRDEAARELQAWLDARESPSRSP